MNEMESVSSSRVDSAMSKQKVTAGGGRTNYDNTRTSASRDVGYDLTDIRVHGMPSSTHNDRDYNRDDSRPDRGYSGAKGGSNNGGYRPSTHQRYDGHRGKAHVDISCRPDFGVYLVGAMTALVVILFFVIIVH